MRSNTCQSYRNPKKSSSFFMTIPKRDLVPGKLLKQLWHCIPRIMNISEIIHDSLMENHLLHKSLPKLAPKKIT